GLALTSALPQGRARTQLEFSLWTALGTVLNAMHGYAAPAVDRAFRQARALARALGDPPEALHVLLAQSMFFLMRGEMAHAWQEGEQVLRRAEELGDRAYIMTAHVLLGTIAVYRADYARARKHLERCIELYDVNRFGELAYRQGQDPGVVAHAFLSRVLWLQGYPEQALDAGRAAVALADEVGHPYSQAMAVMHLATLYSFLRRWPECQRAAGQALQLAEDGGFAMWRANAAIIRGTVLVHQGSIAEGMAAISRGLFVWEATGAGLVAFGATCMAEACRLEGRREEGLRVLDESLYRSEEAWWQPEQYRLRAELLLLAPGHEAEARDLLLQALDLARSQGARSLELRVAMSLARLARHAGQPADEMGALAEAHAYFFEGLDSGDLREASTLLGLGYAMEAG
ncbi:MAG: hypothetical protein PVG11_08040, partial [Anaerolineae bacterium]